MGLLKDFFVKFTCFPSVCMGFLKGTLASPQQAKDMQIRVGSVGDTSNLTKVYPAFGTMSDGIGSSPSATLKWMDGWMCLSIYNQYNLCKLIHKKHMSKCRLLYWIDWILFLHMEVFFLFLPIK